MFKNNGNKELALQELKSNKATALIMETKGNGVVVTLKDLYATKEYETKASSKILEGFVPGYNATIVNKLIEADAQLVAKVHMDELALGGTGQYSAYGPINNPLDEKRIAGGSSSGSAATFTKNIGVAIGSDTGDSVRLPASYTGVLGYKPSYGAISRYGQFAYATSLDTVGYFAHNTHDIIEMSRILFGKDELDMTSKEVEKPTNEVSKPKTIGFIKNNSAFKDYQLSEYSKLKEKLIADGIEVKEFELNEELLSLIDIVYQVISFSEASSNDANLNGISFGPGSEGKDWSELMTNTRSKLLGDYIKRRFTLGALFLSGENQKEVFEQAQKVRRLIVDMFNDVKNQVDVLVFPSTPIAPLLVEEKGSSWAESILINTNFSGAPSITLPWAKHDGMPFGLSLEGLLYEDKKLLSHALYIEELLGGGHE